MPFRFDWDGHVHSGLCPHGSGHSTDEFIEQALIEGFDRVSILEHYPLPLDFPWPETSRPVCFGPDMFEPFLEQTLALREEYKSEIDVLVGFEWDFIPGREKWLIEQLDKVGPRVQDGILSVHYVMDCIIDEAADIFTRDVLPKVGGNIETAYEVYYRTLLDAVRADLGLHKPPRLGHVNLIRRFQEAIPAPNDYRGEIMAVVNEASKRGMQLDFNMSGLRKPRCQEPYLPQWLIESIARGEPDIMCVFGSDAHAPDEVGWGLNVAEEMVAIASRIGVARKLEGR